MKFKAEIDFKTAVSEANKAGKAIQSAFEKASSEGIAGRAFAVGLRKNIALAEKLTADLVKKRLTIEKRADFAAKNAAKDLAKYKAELESDLAKKKAALQSEADEERKAALKEEIAQVEELVQLSDELNKDAKAFAANTNKMVAGLHKAGQDGQKLQKNIENSAKAAKEIADAFDDLIDPSKVGEKMEGMAENIGEAFKNGIDVQSLSKDLGKGLSKAITVAGKSLGSGSAAMMAVTGVIAGTVAALGILLAAFIAVDKKVKDFNKGVIKTHGALSLVNVGGGNLAKGLNIVRHAVQDLSGNLGVSESDALALFDTLDRGGITLERLTRGATDAADAQDKLNASVRRLHSIANMMGVSLTEYAENLTNYVDDLAMSTDTVNESFAEIAHMASRAGFGTRRFYSMVVQATSGQSSLNVRLEQTGDLLMRMSKIMGMKKAAELASGAGAGLADASAQDRARAAILTGGRGRQIMQRDAAMQARNFAQANQNQGAVFGRALESAGLGGTKLQEAFDKALSDPRGLVNALGRLNMQQQRALLSSLRASGDPHAEEMARQLTSLATLSRGANGSLDDIVNSQQEMSVGANMAYAAAKVQGVIGERSLQNLTVAQRAAAESITGLSGRQFEAFVTQMRAQQGDLETMLRAPNSPEAVNLMKMYHLEMRNGRLFDEANNEIRTGNDLFQTTAAQEAARAQTQVVDAEALAVDTMEATVSVADILENQIYQVLQGIYDQVSGYIVPFLESIARVTGAQDVGAKIRNQQEILKEIGNQMASLGEEDRTRNARIVAAQRKLMKDSGATEEQKKTATKELKRLQSEREASRTRRQNLEDARRRALRGEGAGDMAVQETRIADASVGEVLTSPGAITAFAGQLLAGGGLGMARDAGRSQLKHYASREEALRAGVDPSNMRTFTNTRQLTAQERVARLMGTAAPAAAPAAAAPAAAATPAAGAAPAVSVAPPTPQVAERQAAPAVAATESAASEQARRDQRALQTANRQHDQLIGQLKGRALGDALADSRLPQAIAVADAKMRLLESLYAGGASTLPAEQINRLLAGTATPEDLGAAGAAGQQARALQFMSAPPVQDFVYQDRGGRSVITPISREDQVTGAKPGGPIAAAATRPGGNVVVHIHGGDERRIFDVVKRAIIGAGITPNRVPGVT